MRDRHDQEVPGVDRGDVHERDARVIAIHDAGWRATSDDVAEDASGHSWPIQKYSRDDAAASAPLARLFRQKLLETGHQVVPARLFELQHLQQFVFSTAC